MIKNGLIVEIEMSRKNLAYNKCLNATIPGVHKLSDFIFAFVKQISVPYKPTQDSEEMNVEITYDELMAFVKWKVEHDKSGTGVEIR